MCMHFSKTRIVPNNLSATKEKVTEIKLLIHFQKIAMKKTVKEKQRILSAIKLVGNIQLIKAKSMKHHTNQKSNNMLGTKLN